ncbi:hypothetical protein OG713_45770 (plasmid) [Streptomyces sp. NBC_00723]|uniref:hypothetical protein n=1 Tax=Streptomyces sp. NBC_00723 TaxID=2903673 RepID=UPI00386CFA9F
MKEVDSRLVDLWNDVESWREFVEECRDGYPDSLAEYEFDLSVRDRLQVALGDETMQTPELVEEFRRFRQAVERIDQEFSALASVVRPVAEGNVLPWWHLRIPRSAGRELADELFQRLDVVITVVE